MSELTLPISATAISKPRTANARRLKLQDLARRLTRSLLDLLPTAALVRPDFAWAADREGLRQRVIESAAMGYEAVGGPTYCFVQEAGDLAWRVSLRRMG